MPSVLFFTYEYVDPIFSGNGTHSRVLVDGLLKSRPDTEIFVICATPQSSSSSSTSAQCSAPSERLTVVAVPVDAAKWRRLDRECDWQGYAAGVSCIGVEKNSNTNPTLLDGEEGEAQQQACCPLTTIRERLRQDAFEAVMCVDWHGFLAMESLFISACGPCEAVEAFRRKSYFLNFRVFGLMSSYYQVHETRALLFCKRTVVLSQFDQNALEAHAKRVANTTAVTDGAAERSSCSSASWEGKCVIVPSPVRDAIFEGVEQFSRDNDDNGGGGLAAPAELQQHPLGAELLRSRERRLVCCCVRLSSEKQPHRFVRLVKSLIGSGYIPLLLGSVGEEAYAAEVKQSLLNDWGADGCIIVSSFVSPLELSTIYSLSAANIHPCSYDAFGLTITEAAVCGCPTIIIRSDADGSVHVGATALLGEGGYLTAGLSDDSLTARLEDKPSLMAVAAAARQRASSYDTATCGQLLSRACGL